MTEDQIKIALQELKEKYPIVERVVISYQGSGDSFDSYDLQEIEPAKAKVDLTDFEPIFWALIDKVDSNFNDDGSRGEVIFDFKENTVSIDDYYYHTEESFQGNVTIG